MTKNEPGVLYLVGTPIGNLEDITLRALRILKEVDLIACEDTRQTIKLLNHFEIKNRLVAYHKFNEKRETQELIKRLKSGESVALVSDAGLPIISDPGSELVRACQEEGIAVSVVPGANAALSALMMSGMDARRFTFFGFPGKAKKDERLFFKEVMACPNTAIVYESPHHLLKALKQLEDLGPEREISISREITKRFEETLRGKPGELIVHFKENPPKGEFVIVVEASPKAMNQELANTPIPERVRELVDAGLSEKEAIKKVAKERGVGKREVYEIVKIKS